jgi:hypothetical protein
LSLIRRDVNEIRFNAIFLLSKSDPNFWRDLLKNARVFFYGMNQPELIKELDEMVEYLIEKPMGSDINTILLIHKNLPTMNSFTRSRNPLHTGENIYKSTITMWLQKVEDFIYQKAISLEGQIHFGITAKQWI